MWKRYYIGAAVEKQSSYVNLKYGQKGKRWEKRPKKKKSGIICNIFQLLILPVFYHDLHRASYLFIFLPGLNLERQGMRVRQEYKMAHFSKFRVNRWWNPPKQHLKFSRCENSQKKLGRASRTTTTRNKVLKKAQSSSLFEVLCVDLHCIIFFLENF